MGDLVWCNSLGNGGRQGASAEYAAVASDRVYPLPAEVDPISAVALLHPVATAFLALHSHARVGPGDLVYVGGGAGNVGSALTVVARRAGAAVVASARPEDFEHCRRLGAARLIDYQDDVAAELRRQAPGGIDVFADTSGRLDLAAAVDQLTFGGRVIVLAGMADLVSFTAGALYTHHRSILGFAISNATTIELSAAADEVNEILGARELVPRHVDVLPLAQAARAHELLENGQVHASRLVLVLVP